MSKKPTVLMILDGWGINENSVGNAVAQSNTPNLDMIMAKYPCVPGQASALDVGLPEGQMGNSEVGHLNIGAGRIIYQELTRITKEIKDGTFFENKELLRAIDNCKKNNSALHTFGLLSDGGVHSHITHLYALIEMCKKNGLDKVYVHVFLDGRDTAPTSGKGFVEDLQNQLDQIGVGKIATVMGRYYSMDRDNRWDRVKLAYDAMVIGSGDTATSALEAVAYSYKTGLNDEFVLPTVIIEDGKPVATINENDSVVVYNFRPDRAREITRAFCMPDFDGFDRSKGFVKLTYVCYSEYDVTIPNKTIAFEKTSFDNTLGQVLAANNLKQLRLAETEKYAHVTFFFNGGVEIPNEGEDRVLINSPKVATYDLQPEMSAYAVGDELVKAIKEQKHDVIIINFANPDMVGHTGIMAAAVKALETVDACVGKAYEALMEVDGQMFICADHGNLEQLVDYVTGEPFTAHTTNPVPFVLVNAGEGIDLRKDGRLADIAPTLLDMIGVAQPKEMTGKSLLVR
ncbi:MAG: 2,3-bisphosphoglycerate-independent phosphoglycerate mutase [Clostridiales bacterium]|jgi:2,3-bisphosphoglycerate-independent phosphoglycerate mutase|nr:2,3-bisphosphoglycerate-independent phosphoglycerate mutase [Clostridiales bacterium]